MKQCRLDERRKLVIPGNAGATVDFAIQHWVESANQAIDDHGFFAVALSGGSTPKKIFQGLATSHKDSLDWSKVRLFWSDERAVPPSDPESNFHMAMTEGNLSSLPIQKKHIHRMVAEKDLEQEARAYEQLIINTLGPRPFDLIMLGMGDDGHTASLFPNTAGVAERNRLVIANYVPQKSTWRMSFTFTLINEGKEIAIYVIGENKAQILHQVLCSEFKPKTFPSQALGTPSHPATWIIDEGASGELSQLNWS